MCSWHEYSGVIVKPAPISAADDHRAAAPESLGRESRGCSSSSRVLVLLQPSGS